MVCTKPVERRKHAELLCHAMDAWGALKHFAPRGIIYLGSGSGLAYCGETVQRSRSALDSSTCGEMTNQQMRV
jgi:hypothetical protein